MFQTQYYLSYLLKKNKKQYEENFRLNVNQRTRNIHERLRTFHRPYEYEKLTQLFVFKKYLEQKKNRLIVYGLKIIIMVSYIYNIQILSFISFYIHIYLYSFLRYLIN